MKTQNGGIEQRERERERERERRRKSNYRNISKSGGIERCWEHTVQKDKYVLTTGTVKRLHPLCFYIFKSTTTTTMAAATATQRIRAQKTAVSLRLISGQCQ